MRERERAAGLLSVSHGQADCPRASVHHLHPHCLHGLITQLNDLQHWIQSFTYAYVLKQTLACAHG